MPCKAILINTDLPSMLQHILHPLLAHGIQLVLKVLGDLSYMGYGLLLPANQTPCESDPHEFHCGVKTHANRTPR